MNYYIEIKNELLNNEIYKKVKDYSKNKHDLSTYYKVGRLLSEAGKCYGEGIIKEYSKKLNMELGRGYGVTTLKYMRKFYLLSKSQPVADFLSWSHYMILLTIKDIHQMNYYIEMCRKYNLSKRQLIQKIKLKEYERLDEKTKEKLINNIELEISDFIKNPIVIKNSLNYEQISENILKKLILEDIDAFLNQLGYGFMYVGCEYKINMGNTYNYIDMLLYNIEFNCYVVVELKVIELKKEHIGQIQVYMNYIDKNIKKINMDNTIGIIVTKYNNEYITLYSSDSRIKTTTYTLSK